MTLPTQTVSGAAAMLFYYPGLCDENGILHAQIDMTRGANAQQIK